MAATTTSAADERVVQDLIDRGRRNGNRLSVEQMGSLLPIETMTPGEVAGIVERLESAGIDVDLDESRLKQRRAGVYAHGEGVVDLASPAAPAVSAPGVAPSRHGWSDDGAGQNRAAVEGPHGGAPTVGEGGMDLLPIISLVVVALVLIIALG